MLALLPPPSPLVYLWGKPGLFSGSLSGTRCLPVVPFTDSFVGASHWNFASQLLHKSVSALVHV